jgi:NAD+ kinase
MTSKEQKRKAVFVVNRNRQEAIDAESSLKSLLTDFEFVEDQDAEIVVVLGGDGTILRGAVVARRLNVPLLGVNLGRVGFMAEVEKSTYKEIADAIINRSYTVEPRLVLEYRIERNGKEVATGWALNEVTIECEQGTMIELLLQIDGRPISSWWADGLIVATPTGSTAYAFSVGGPIIWPQTEALVVTPIAAHALFTRPLVISPTSDIAIDILSEDGVVKADALRFEGLLVGDRVLVNRAKETIKLAHVRPTSFSDRLVAKFKLPIEGWRGE